MLSAAMAEARRRGAGRPLPVLRVAWAARGLDLGTGIYAPAIVHLPGVGQVSAITQLGAEGWSPIEYGPGVEGSELEVVESRVAIADKSGTLLRMLETYNPRGSEASSDWALPQLVEGDWTPLFRGIVADWERQDPYTALLMKTDDTVLRSPVPSATFQRTEWGSADEPSIFGTHFPLQLGVHDSWQTTGRGMARAINIAYSESPARYWWVASLGQFVSIRRIAFDGIAQGDAGWTTRNVVYGQNRMTLIVVTPGSQPSKGVVVSFDCAGPDEDGLSAGLALTGAPDQLRVILNEYAYRAAPLFGFRGDTEIVHPASWDAASAFFALNGIESARSFGGEQEPESVSEVIDSYHEAYPWARIYWTPLGQLAHGYLDPDDVEPDPTLHLDLIHQAGDRLPYEPGDRREVYTHVKTQFMYSSAEQKFLTEYQAHDVAALPEKVVLTIENLWGPGRLTQDTALNPAAPPDPTP